MFSSLLESTYGYGGLALVLGAGLVSVVTQQNVRVRELRGRATTELDDAPDANVPTRAVIVGAGAVGRSLAGSLESTGRYDVVGYIEDHPNQLSDPADRPILGSRAETPNIILTHAVDEVFVAYAPSWPQQLAEELILSGSSVSVRVVPSPFDSLLRSDRIESIGDIAIVRMTTGKGKLTQSLKRALDVILSISGLVLGSAVLAGVAAVIRLTSRGEVIFRQDRVGLNGQVFTLYKFRTMVTNAEAATGPILAEGSYDSRLTRVGRILKAFRLDELPQLWNVLRGDMSLVGPRPERPCFARKFEDISPTYSQRHLVRPGITGLAQVCGGYHTHWRDKLRFDLFYVSRQSLLLDASILLRTLLFVVLPGRHR